MIETKRRIWAEINLDAIENNIKLIRKVTNPASQIMAIVKADAYGHGTIEVAKTLLANGADRLGVACVDEAKQLRNAGVDVPILILGKVFKHEFETLIDLKIAATVFDFSEAKLLSDIAVKKGKKAIVHIKIDTGMKRIGIIAGKSDTVEKIKNLYELPGLDVEGIFSHLSCADTEKEEFTLNQIALFEKTVSEIENNGIIIPIKHIANSAAIIRYPQSHFNMVRAGLICYGYLPSKLIKNEGFIPAMSFKTLISRIETINEGDIVSYGGTFRAEKPTKIASLCVGYADGYLRGLSNKAEVIIGGKKVKIVGNICMDQCMADVSNVNNINVGDVATLFGTDGETTVLVDELAEISGTINYEIVCMVSKRVPRIYFKNNCPVSEVNYIL